MKTIHIKQKGFLIQVGNKIVRTPLIIKCDPEMEALILEEIKKYNIVYYEIDEGVTKMPELIKPSKPYVPPIQKVSSDLLKKYILNYKKDNNDPKDHKPLKLTVPILEKIQATTNIIDYTSEMSPVKNQGSLGSCVGFAVVAMKEWQEQQEHMEELAEGKKYKRAAKHYDLSEQWMYYKCKEIDYWPGEEGTSIRFAMQILNRVGVPCEKAWPYNASYIGKPKRWANLVSKWALGGEYIRMESPEDIINSLGTNGPLAIGIACFIEIFYATSNGIVAYPSAPDQMYGGHAICLVGWNPETRMFKFKNSWGTSWGQNGYGYLPYDYIRDFCWDAWEIKDLSVTKEMLKG